MVVLPEYVFVPESTIVPRPVLMRFEAVHVEVFAVPFATGAETVKSVPATTSFTLNVVLRVPTLLSEKLAPVLLRFIVEAAAPLTVTVPFKIATAVEAEECTVIVPPFKLTVLKVSMKFTAPFPTFKMPPLTLMIGVIWDVAPPKISLILPLDCTHSVALTAMLMLRAIVKLPNALLVGVVVFSRGPIAFSVPKLMFTSPVKVLAPERVHEPTSFLVTATLPPPIPSPMMPVMAFAPVF